MCVYGEPPPQTQHRMAPLIQPLWLQGFPEVTQGILDSEPLDTIATTVDEIY